MILYVNANSSVKKYRQMLRDLNVDWYRVRGQVLIYDVSMDSNVVREYKVKVVTIEVNEAGAALFKLCWNNLLIPYV